MTGRPLNLITSGAFVGAELAAEFGELPPAFLPAGHRRLYTFGVERLGALGGDTVLTLPSSFEMPAWDSAQLRAANVQVLRVPAELSLGASIAAALREVGAKGPVRLLHGDTLFLSDLPSDWDVVSVSNTHYGYTWGYVSGDGLFEAAPADRVRSDALVLTGYFAFSDAELWRRSLEDCEGSFIAALNTYAASRQLARIAPQPWLDFGHLQPFYRSRSLITTQRAFNGLAVTDRYVEKWSDHADRMNAEISWYEALPPPLRLYTPAYLGQGRRLNGARSYRTAYEHAPTLHELYVFGRLGDRVWRRIFETCFEVLAAFAEHRTAPAGNPLRDLTVAKTLGRLEQWAGEEPVDVLSREWRYAGRRLPSLTRIVEETAARIDFQTDRYASLMHGDFGFPNIFFHFRSQKITLIDPRGEVTPGETSLYGDTRYDLAKLNHSLEGYDLILAGMHALERPAPFEMSLFFPEDSFRSVVRAVSREFSIGDRRLGDPEVTALTVHLFLSMLPLHADHPERQHAFLANALRLFSSLEDQA